MGRGEWLQWTLGIAGYAVMLFAAFGYSWRKNLRRSSPGPVRTWMQWHVVAGFVGPALVLLHTRFTIGGVGGAALVLTLVVVLSGAVGRWGYTSIPSPGWVPSLDETAAIDAEIAAFEAPQDTDFADDAGGGVATASLRRADHVAEARLRGLRRLRAEHDAARRHADALKARRRMLASWWAFHVPVTAAMLTLGLVHAVAAIYFTVLTR